MENSDEKRFAAPLPQYAAPDCYFTVDAPPLDDAAAEKYLRLQQNLRDRRLRGSMQDVRDWIAQGKLCSCPEVNAEAVGLLVYGSDLRRRHSILSESADYLEGWLTRYGPWRQLRPADHLYLELAWRGPSGTCCLIGPDRVLTASHVIGESARDAIESGDFYAVFDFQTHRDSGPTRIFNKARSIFRIAALGPGDTGSTAAEDWMTLQLERSPTEVSNRRWLRIAKASIDLRREAYTLGHPRALLMRYARSPTISKSAFPHCFEAFFDAYDGGSGSPVFDATTHELVGLLIASCAGDSSRIFTCQDDYLSSLWIPETQGIGATFLDAQHFASKVQPPDYG